MGSHRSLLPKSRASRPSRSLSRVSAFQSAVRSLRGRRRPPEEVQERLRSVGHGRVGAEQGVPSVWRAVRVGGWGHDDLPSQRLELEAGVPVQGVPHSQARRLAHVDLEAAAAGLDRRGVRQAEVPAEPRERVVAVRVVARVSVHDELVVPEAGADVPAAGDVRRGLGRGHRRRPAPAMVKRGLADGPPPLVHFPRAVQRYEVEDQRRSARGLRGILGRSCMPERSSGGRAAPNGAPVLFRAGAHDSASLANPSTNSRGSRTAYSTFRPILMYRGPPAAVRAPDFKLRRAYAGKGRRRLGVQVLPGRVAQPRLDALEARQGLPQKLLHVRLSFRSVSIWRS
jgi:hypothetical protein